MKRIFSNFINKPYFTKQDLVILADKFSIARVSLNTLIQRALKKKTIVSLKRNYYVTNEFFQKNRNKLEYKFFIANTLVKPSYISREAALQYHGLLSEASLNYYTCATTKLPRKIKNSTGIYEYRNIKSELFNGYYTVKFALGDSEYSYSIAEPYKAIYDYIYYRTSKRRLSEEILINILNELRIDHSEIEETQLNKLIKLFA